MSFTKPRIYNLTLSALKLASEVVDVTTDTSNEVRVLNTHWDIAFESTLQDLDLDATGTPKTLELLADISSNTDYPWNYVYKYPDTCTFLRRLVSGAAIDSRSTHISKRTGVYEGKLAIFTNQPSAVAEIIGNDVPLAALNPMAGMAVAYKLAYLSAPLLTGKGALKLRKEIEAQYIFAKGEAQEIDRLENFNYEADSARSEFVAARLE